MSKLKKTPLMKFMKLIKENEKHFEDKEFYKFLLEAGLSFMEKEKKGIVRAYNNGTIDGRNNLLNNSTPLDGSYYYSERYLGDINAINRFRDSESFSKLMKLMFGISDNEQETTEKEQSNDSKISEFCKTLSDNPISVNEESETPAKEQIEELLLDRLKKVGIEPTSVKIVKL
jgi:hypothetical protein